MTRCAAAAGGLTAAVLQGEGSSHNSDGTIAFEHVLYHNQEDGTEMLSGVKSTATTEVIKLTVGGGVLGDINGDGSVDQKDAQMILDCEAQVSDRTLNMRIADVSGDGVIDSNDAALILQYAAGTITEFPAEQEPPSDGQETPSDEQDG